MTEINEKLARFAGLHRNEPNGGTWWDKDGHTVDILFTESLDAQAKYLWPKLYRVEIVSFAEHGGFARVKSNYKDVGVCIAVHDDSFRPAQASAQAIAKLLEVTHA